MKSKCLSKSRFIAILCCLCLGLSAMMASIFLFSKHEKVFAETEVAGFYVEDGASVRFDDARTGLRFKTVVTEEQYNAWKDTYGNNATYDFHTVISYATPGDEAVDVDAVADIASHDFANGDFVYYGAIFFDLKDGSQDLPADELAEIFAAEYKAESYVLINGDKVNAESEDTLRSIRSVAMSNVLKETVSDTAKNDILKKFIKNESEGALVAPALNVSAENYYYDNYRDATAGLTIALDDEIPAGTKVVGMVGATAIPETDFIVTGDTVTVKNVAKYLAIGETEFFSLDIPALNKVISFSNVLEVTEVFYNEKDGVTGAERLNARFAIKSEGADETERLNNYFSEANKVTEIAYDEEGVAFSMDFYNVDRGYYVLAEDITFLALNESTAKWEPSKNAEIEKYAMNHDVFTYPGGNTGAKLNSGLFGFGGTFDGLGHTIYGLKTSYITNGYATSGLFGALAYGATVKNVAFENATKRSYENHTHASILATFAGSTATVNGLAKEGTDLKNNYDFLVAKYGSEDCITIDNCYFGMDKSVVKDSDQSIFEVPKVSNATYAQGTFAVTHEGDAKFMTYSNCVLDMINQRPVYGHQDNGGFGWIGRTAGHTWINNNDGIFENCYMISTQRADGEVPTVFEHRAMTINYEDGTAGTRSNWYIEEIEGVTYYGTKTAGEWDKKGTSWTNLPGNSVEFYAANDFAAIENGTEVFSGLDDGAWVVSADSAYTANVTLYHYTDLYRFNNYIDMSANNTASIANFNDSWVKVGNAVVWKGLADKNPDGSVNTDLRVEITNLTNPGSTALEVGDELSVAVFYGNKDVTSAATLSTESEGIFSIEGNVITCIATGEAVLNVTAGGFTAAADILVTINNASELVVSAMYSEIYSTEGAAYSVPYVMTDGDLVATTYTALYQQAFVDNGATVTAIYEVVNGVKTALELVEVDGEKYVLVSNPGNERKVYTIIIEGTKGLVTLGNLTVVTGVITDDTGFKYIPSTATTRAGYYVLANDYNDKKDNSKAYTASNSKLGDYVGSDPLGYSLGGLDLDRLAIVGSHKYAYQPFTGTFDGLGHTIDNLMVAKNGILGAFTDVDQGALLTNVIFKNYRMAYHVWTGAMKDGVKVKTNDMTQNIIAGLGGAYGNKQVLTADQQVKLFNVVIEMATTDLFFNNAAYGYGEVNSKGEPGEPRWSFFRWIAYADIVDGVSSITTPNSYHRSINKINLNNVIFNYAIPETMGKFEANYGGAMILSSTNECYSDVAYRVTAYALKDVTNTYLISAPTAGGRTAWVALGCGTSSEKSCHYVGMPINDLQATFGTALTEFTGNGATYYSTADSSATAAYEMRNGNAGCGWLTVDGNKTWVYTTDLAAYKAEKGEAFELFVSNLVKYQDYVFYSTPFIRYNDYSAMATAGVSSLGNIAISATGISWTEAK